MTNLPAELLPSIVTTRETCLALTLVNKYYNSIVNPILYKRVELERDTLQAFSRTLVSCCPILREYPVYLHIHYLPNPLDPAESEEFKPVIKRILMHVPNLKHLRLTSSHSNNPMARYLVDVNGSRYPFTLRKLEMNPVKELKAEFIEFLRAQPGIEKVSLSEGDLRDRPNWDISTSLPSDILPKLRSIRSDATTISFMIPDHPVSRVVLRGPLLELDLGVHKVLAKSLKPLERLNECVGLPDSGVSWEYGILSCFSSLAFCQKSLSSYSLRFSPGYWFLKMNGHFNYSAQSFLKNRDTSSHGLEILRNGLSSFTALRKFTLNFSVNPYYHLNNDISPEFCNTIPELSRFEVWQASCPSLEEVSLFGVTLRNT